MEPTRRGDPESPLCWTTLTTRRLAAELTGTGHKVGPDTVAKLLVAQGFSLQGNAKTIEGGQHADRDAQFSYLGDQVRQHLDGGDPVISVDGTRGVPDSQMNDLHDSGVLTRHDWHPEWNYTLNPTS